DGGGRLLRPETRIPADQRSGLDRLSRVLRSGLRHAQAARGRRYPQRCQQWRRGGLVCAGSASSQHRRGPQVLERRIPGDQGSLSRRVRADGPRTRARGELSADRRGDDQPGRRQGDFGGVELRDGSDRAFLDSPKAEWLWEFAAANGIVVHIHPPMLSVGHEVLMQYCLNEAVGRPFDSTVNGARMIASGLFDRHPKLQVLIVHMGGELASVLGRLEFNWRLNYKGIRNPPAGKPYKNDRPPSDYLKTNILVDCMGFNPIGLRAAVEMCGADRVVFGSDYGPIPYGIKEHVQIVEDVLPSPAERQQVFWKTSNRVFRLGLFDTDLITL